MKAPRPVTFSLLLVLVFSVWDTQPVWRRIAQHWNDPPHPSWVVPPGQTIAEAQADTDTVLIHGGLVKAPRFRDTFRWWTGTWAGQVPFYRPLPSLLFWCEWKLYGDRENRYAIFPLLFYFLALSQFLRLASALFIYARCPLSALATFLSGMIFTDGLRMFSMRSSANGTVMGQWKNQPDSLCAFFFFLSLCYYLQGLSDASSVNPEAQEKGAEKEGHSFWHFSRLQSVRIPALWVALALYLAGCASKEAGVVLPLLLLVLEAPALLSRQRPRIRAAVTRLSPFLIALPLFLAYRTWCLGTATGFQYGSNGSWSARMLSSAFGPVSASAVMSQWPTITLSLILATVLLNARTFWKRRKTATPRPLWQWLVLVSLLISILIGVNLTPNEPGLSSTERLISSLLSYHENGYIRDAFILAVFMVGAISGMRRRPLIACFGYLWVLLELVLLAMSPSPPHRYYLLEGGYALWIGSGLAIFVSEFLPSNLKVDRTDKNADPPTSFLE